MLRFLPSRACRTQVPAVAPILDLVRRLLHASPSSKDDVLDSDEEVALYASMRALMHCITLPRAREALTPASVGLIERLAQQEGKPAWPMAREAAAQLLKYLRSLNSKGPTAGGTGAGGPSAGGPGALAVSAEAAAAVSRAKAAATERRARARLEGLGLDAGATGRA